MCAGLCVHYTGGNPHCLIMPMIFSAYSYCLHINMLYYKKRKYEVILWRHC